MSKSLLQRYTYGNFGDLPTFSAEEDFLLGGPVRQRELVALAKSQLALTSDATAMLRKSRSEVAAVVCCELERQTAALSEVVREVTDRVATAVDNLADQVSAELCEIRWQLVQLRSSTDQILQVLKRPRSIEAQELLRQGLRDLVNDKLEQAEDRFLRALDLDHTDYQVLMNLSAVELRKDNAEKAASFLQDALTLPADLDAVAQAETLWSLARVYYAEANYRKAATRARESLSLVTRPRRLFQYGIYLVLATEALQGLPTIEAAIRENPRLFGLAAISPDLVPYNERVGAILSSLAKEAVSQVRSACDELSLRLPALRELPHISAETVTAELAYQLDALGRVLERPAYSELRIAGPHAEDLLNVLSGCERLSAAEARLVTASAQHAWAIREVSAAEVSRARSPKAESNRGCLAFLSGFIGFTAGPILPFLTAFNPRGQQLLESLDDLHLVALYLFFSTLGALISMFLVDQWEFARRRKRILREGHLQAARERFDAASALLAVATAKRESALLESAIPPWPLASPKHSDPSAREA